MPIWLQQYLVLAAVAGAAIYVMRQAVATLRAGKGGFGSCCAKGCQSQPHAAQKTPSTDRVVFLPVESLSRRRK
jgi:hypothetical protein